MGNKYNDIDSEWVSLPDYDGYYIINKNGVVKSLDRAVPDKRLGVRNIKGVTIKHIKTKFGYVTVQLWKDKKFKSIFVHRLLGIIFIKNPENKRDINHINGIRDDNRIENLEWNTRSENVKHGYRSNGRISSVTKRIKCLSNGIEYNSLTDASNLLGIDIRLISAVCRGRQSHTNNLKFCFL